MARQNAMDDRTEALAIIYSAAADSVESAGYDATATARSDRGRHQNAMLSGARAACDELGVSASEFVSEYIKTFDKLTYKHATKTGSYARKSAADILRRLARELFMG